MIDGYAIIDLAMFIGIAITGYALYGLLGAGMALIIGALVAAMLVGAK